VFEHDRIRKLVETLTDCLVELDRIEAHIAGAHLDSALHALRRQFGFAEEISVTE